MNNNIENQRQSVGVNPDGNKDEVNLVEVVQKVWENRKFILIITAIFASLGLIVALSSDRVYTAYCTLVPQTGQKSSGGSLGGLAAIAGINLGSLSSGEVLSPIIYPKIIKNINFQKELIYSKFHFEVSEQPITLYDYYITNKYKKFSLSGTVKKYTIGLPSVIIGAIKDKENIIENDDSLLIQSMTEKEKIVANILSKNISISVNNKDGYVSISVNMPEPLVAAELCQATQELLQKYITDFKIEKVASNLEFVERSYEDGKRNFESKQVELARFRDANKNFTSEVAKTQEEKLTSEYNLFLDIYTELAKQKEQAKIAVTETTPILTVIEPVIVPFEKTKPKTSVLILIYTFLGLIIGIGIVFTVPYLEDNFFPNIKDYRFIPRIY